MMLEIKQQLLQLVEEVAVFLILYLRAEWNMKYGWIPSLSILRILIFSFNYKKRAPNCSS